jgi:hypothetical protein
MSYVTRGLGRKSSGQQGSYAAWGMGRNSRFIVICPVEQVTTVLSSLQSAGATESELTVSIISIELNIAVIEYEHDPSIDEYTQRVDTLGRFIDIGLQETEMEVEIVEIAQQSDLIEVLQSVEFSEQDLTIVVSEISEDISIYDTIDKVIE